MITVTMVIVMIINSKTFNDINKEQLSDLREPRKIILSKVYQ